MPTQLRDPRLVRCFAAFRRLLDIAVRLFGADHPERSQQLVALENRAELQFAALDAAVGDLLAGRPFPSEIAGAANEFLSGIENLAQQLAELPRPNPGSPAEGVEGAVFNASLGASPDGIQEVVSGLLASRGRPLSRHQAGYLATVPAFASLVGTIIDALLLLKLILLLFLLWLIFEVLRALNIPLPGLAVTGAGGAGAGGGGALSAIERARSIGSILQSIDDVLFLRPTSSSSTSSPSSSSNSSSSSSSSSSNSSSSSSPSSDSSSSSCVSPYAPTDGGIIPSEDRDGCPLIFVPGFLGSVLRWEVAGFPLEQVWPLDLRNLVLRLYLLQHGDLTPDGLVSGAYDPLIDFVLRPRSRGGLGRTLDKDFWIFAYDWRAAVSQTGFDLTRFITSKLHKANQMWRSPFGKPDWDHVDVICHSMGGLVARDAMKEWNAPINCVAYIATPHYGAPKAFFAVHPDTGNIVAQDFMQQFINIVYPRIALQRISNMLRTWQATFDLMPDEFYLDANHYLIFDGPINSPVIGPHNTYFTGPWQFQPPLDGLAQRAIDLKHRLGPKGAVAPMS